MNIITEKKLIHMEYKTFYTACFKNYTIGVTLPYKYDDRWAITYRKMKPRGTATVTKYINPYYKWKRKLKWSLQYTKLKLHKEKYKICEGCGEGISKYRIRNPNKGHGNERFNCCEGCVDFYDWRWSAMDIVNWEGKKPICKKGSRCIENKKNE